MNNGSSTASPALKPRSSGDYSVSFEEIALDLAEKWLSANAVLIKEYETVDIEEEGRKVASFYLAILRTIANG